MDAKGGARRVSAALALLALLGSTGFAAPAPDEAAQRRQARQLNEVTGKAAMKGLLRALVADEAGTKKLLAAAARMAKEAPQTFNRNATLLLALAAEELKEVEVSAAFFRLNAQQELKLRSENGVAQAYTGLIQLYFDHGKYAEAEKVCREFLKLEIDEDAEDKGPDGRALGQEDRVVRQLRPVVRRRLILAVAKGGRAQKALDMAEDEIKKNPENWLYRVTKAQVLRAGEKLEEAAKVYVDVIERVGKDRRLEKEERDDYVSEYRYALSGLYVDLDQVDKAAEQLKWLLEKDPNNPTYNNDLGFIWADKGMNLAEAEKLIRRALDQDRKLRRKLKVEEDKDNASYLDSLGWVLFKQGKAREAKAELLKAVKEKDGQNLEIYDHLGDVHLALGEKAEAVAAWKRGLAVAGPGKRDQKRKAEVAKKLKKGE
jgi:tetratricopeptide (TPR) repeat protein